MGELTPVTPRLTTRGANTRLRLIEAAAELMHAQGVTSTTLDEVLAASSSSKSQMYQHFSDKDDLVLAVIDHLGSELLDKQRRRLSRVETFRGLELWCAAAVKRSRVRHGYYGCELGGLASELADRDDAARRRIDAYLQAWTALMEAAVRRMIGAGVLRHDADPMLIAIGLLSALQGGYILAQAAHDPAKMEIALSGALGFVRSFAVT